MTKVSTLGRETERKEEEKQGKTLGSLLARKEVAGKYDVVDDDDGMGIAPNQLGSIRTKGKMKPCVWCSGCISVFFLSWSWLSFFPGIDWVYVINFIAYYLLCCADITHSSLS